MTTDINLSGQWTGTIIYGKGYGQFAGKELYFDLDVIQYRDEIAGTAVDIGGAGTSPDSANILGTFRDNKINFIKQYLSSHYYLQTGDTKIDKSRKGPQIKYSGIYNEKTGTFFGNWVLNTRLLIFGLTIPVPLKNSGTWTMTRK